jgi:cell wall-associated NlpC family hydrolase
MMRDLARYVGIPYRDKGSDPETGLDCWQLVRLFYREELGKTIPDYMAFYRSSLSIVEASGAIVRAIPDWNPVEPPAYGDVLVFRITRSPWHTAICLDDGQMLHTDEGHGSVIEPVSSLRWRDRFYGAYRWKF